MSALSSAYISESAERRQELETLRSTMADQLDESAHARAARIAPVIIALVNGLSPFLIARLILLPLWLGASGLSLPAPPVDPGIGIALVMVFRLGVFPGRVSGTFRLWSGLRAMLLALATAALILAFGS